MYWRGKQSILNFSLELAIVICVRNMLVLSLLSTHTHTHTHTHACMRTHECTHTLFVCRYVGSGILNVGLQYNMINESHVQRALNSFVNSLGTLIFAVDDNALTSLPP